MEIIINNKKFILHDSSNVSIVNGVIKTDGKIINLEKDENRETKKRRVLRDRSKA